MGDPHRERMSFTVFYHSACTGFYGRAWSAIAMLKYGNKEFECKLPEDVPPGVGFAVPMVTLPEGVTISQSGTIALAVGTACGLAPHPLEQIEKSIKAHQLVADGNDLASELFASKPDERIMKWLDYLEGQLQGDYFLGAELSYVDFANYPIFLLIALKKAAGKCPGVEVPPKLAAWSAKMAEIPAVSEMAASGVAYLPDSFV